jgi:hypothetical protein
MNHESTVAAWDTKKIDHVSDEPDMWASVQCEAFWKNVNDHYKALKYSAIPQVRTEPT